MKKIRSIITVVIALVVCAVVLTGCVRDAQIATAERPKSSSTNTNVDSADKSTNTAKSEENANAGKIDESPKTDSGDVHWIGDDWEVVITYDSKDIVTGVVAYNDDTFKSESYSGYEGKDRNTVVNELVTAIEEAGYFVDDIDNELRRITIEISSYYDRDDGRYDDRYFWD